MSKIERTLTISECIELWEKEERLNNKITQLESECAGLRDNADSLRHANQQLHINVAKIIYNIGQMLEATSILIDTSKK